MRHSQNGRLRFGTLTYLRTRIDRIEKEIRVWDDIGDGESVASGEKFLKLANQALHRAEIILSKDGPQDPAEVDAIEEAILQVEESQWGFFKEPGRPM